MKSYHHAVAGGFETEHTRYTKAKYWEKRCQDSMRAEPTRYRVVVLTSWDHTLKIYPRFKLITARNIPLGQ